MVNEIVRRSEFAGAVNCKPVVVVDFYATWCAPCKKMRTVLEDWEIGMADNEEDWMVHFVKVDVDKLPKLARDMDVSSLPTFLVFVHGDLTHTVQGADRKLLRSNIESAMQQAVDHQKQQQPQQRARAKRK